MNESENEQLNQSITLWAAHLNHKLKQSRQSIAHQKFRTSYGRLMRWVLVRLMQLSQVNPAGDDAFGPAVDRRHLPRWSKLVELFIVYFSIKLSFCTLAQHDYNRLSSSVGSIDQQSRDETLANLSEQQLKQQQSQQLAEELQRSIDRLDALGSPLRQLNYLVEGVYICILLFVNALHFIPRLITHEEGHLSISMVRFILNPDKERQNLQVDISQLTNGFLVSSENYLRLRWQVRSKMGQRFRLAVESNRRGSFISNRHELDEHETHSMVVQDVCYLVLAGQLEPLNRCWEWSQAMELLAVWLLIYVNIVGGLLCLCFTFVVPFYVKANFYYHLGPSDCWLFIEIILYLMIGLQLTGLHILTMVMLSIDQIKYANELRHLIQATTWLSDQTCTPPERPELACRKDASLRQLHMQLMRVLLQLRLFRAQLASSRRAKEQGMSLIIMFMAIIPILVRALVVHMSNEMKLASSLGALVIILLADTMILPTCHLYARCLDIHRALSSLLAHLVGATHFGGKELRSSWSATGMSHSQWLLRKDLNMPDGMLEKFATETLFGKLTYHKAIGVHLWCGILLISLWLKGAGSTGNLLVDTFWIT